MKKLSSILITVLLYQVAFAQNVGIGTVTPTSILHVVSPANVDAIVRIENPGSTNEARLEFKKFNGIFNAGVGFYPGNADLHFRTLQASNLVFEPNSVEGMRIDTA